MWRMRRGRCYCATQPNGDVTPCVYIPSLKVGNLRQQSLEQIWECELFRVLSDPEDRRYHCRVCGDRAYRGGCRALSLAYTSDIRAGDPGCERNRDLWSTFVSATRNNQADVHREGLAPGRHD
jgi:radical SAM protein with 4Fe4S-binding SPASM domain